jgi:DNA-binding XRE family transcriptional regulator
MSKNALKEIRESMMMSKAELARKTNISPTTITRIENGMPCRMETQRKIVLALGYKFQIRTKCLAMIWSHLSKKMGADVQVLIDVNLNMLGIFLSRDLIRKEEGDLIEDKNQEHLNNKNIF